MAFYLAVQTLLKRGDTVVVGELSFKTANLGFEHAGANTVILAYDELLSEGWVDARARSGLYVNKDLPLVRNRGGLPLENIFPADAGFELTLNPLLEAPEVPYLPLQFNDGIPDPRLSPLNELGREYHRLLKKAAPLPLFSYADAKGDPGLRNILSKDLGEHRGLKVGAEQLLISRGSIMAFYLVFQHMISLPVHYSAKLHHLFYHVFGSGNKTYSNSRIYDF